MLIKQTKDIEPFVAGDGTILREIINPNDKNIEIRYSLAHAIVHPGDITKRHRLKSSEAYYIIQGKGLVEINNERTTVENGTLIYIPPMASQCIKNIGDIDLIFLCVCDPAWKKADEIIG